MKLKLIENARDWWKMWSVRLMGIGTALQALLGWWPEAGLALWNSMPNEVKMLLPQSIVMTLPLGFFIAAMVARVIKQEKLEKTDG